MEKVLVFRKLELTRNRGMSRIMPLEVDIHHVYTNEAVLNMSEDLIGSKSNV